MLRALIVLLISSSALLFIEPFSSADNSLRVNERATKVTLQENAAVALAVENPAKDPISAYITIELLDAANQSRAHSARHETIKSGLSAINFSLSPTLSGLESSEYNNLPWYRIHYRIRSDGSAAANQNIEGFISLSEITEDIFALNVTSATYATDGMRYQVRAHVFNPASLRPISGVNIDAAINIDDSKEKSIKAAGITDQDGYCLLNFDLPKDIENDEADLKVIAHRGIITKEADSEIKFNNYARILLNTDKPIYQPGQIIHARVLVFDLAKRAIASVDAALQITDPENNTVFHAAMKTSRFGIASADWHIPENSRLGDYEVEVKLDGDKYRGSSDNSIKISRYQLPNFTVDIKPDRAYYLPGQNADVEVRADYLFGQPLKHGHARVARESERKWNYKEQKYDITEAASYEGEIDSNGHFIAHIDLSKDQGDFEYSDYRRFKDLDFAAYVTDASTGRTEQRRFNLRIAKEPIHVYVIEEGINTKNFPLQFLVTTFYADGQPAQCQVTISEDKTPVENGNAATKVLQQLLTIKTNQFGIAKVSNLNLPMRDDDDDRLNLNLAADDGQGRAGHLERSLSFSDYIGLRVETDKTFYRDGDSIVAHITSKKSEMQIVVDVAQDFKIIHSQIAQLHNGEAIITLPYQEKFHDALTITAYSNFGPDFISTYNFPIGSRIVLFPRDRDLKMDANLDQASYRPGDEANANFHIRAANGGDVESALGVVIFDKAVEERARTDRDFSGHYGFYSSYGYLRGETETFAGIIRQDLDQVDLSKPLPEGLDLVAQMILRNEGYFPNTVNSNEYETDPQKVFSSLFDEQFKVIKDHFDDRYQREAIYPTNAIELRNQLDELRDYFERLRDPWGMPYQAKFSTNQDNDVLEIVSTGSDKQFGTADDFTAFRMEWPYFRPYGEIINRAIEHYHSRTDNYIRDAATLKAELLRDGINLDELFDRWGHPYNLKFSIEQTSFVVRVTSNGPPNIFDKSLGLHEFVLWTNSSDYTKELKEDIDKAIGEYFEATKHFPENEEELRTALRRANIDFDRLRDPWGNRYYLNFKTVPRYVDRATIKTYTAKDNETKQQIKITPITELTFYVYIRSCGEDGAAGTADDFDIAKFVHTISEQSAQDSSPQSSQLSKYFSNNTTAIVGVVIDPTGAIISGATITATNKETTVIYTTSSDAQGKFIFLDLLAGTYQINVEAEGFSTTTITNIKVQGSLISDIIVKLMPGGTEEIVDVSGEPESTETLATINTLPINPRHFLDFALTSDKKNQPTPTAPISTPRLRKYFPETLVWQPELVTDNNGQAQMKFKLADNITTWKMSIIASTADGKLGAIEKEFQAFQPFFIDHDPPPVLTEGDQISLPVVLHNYLDKSTSVNLSIAPESWFTLLGPAQKQAEVAAGDELRQTFDLRATACVKAGKQRITAIGNDAGDAIEKLVSVHPDGKENVDTLYQLLDDSSTFNLNIPDIALKSNREAELKIYPNLLAHVAESIEAILQRPYGCAEQTISSTYPSLLILRYLKQNDKSSPTLAEKAQRYLQAGYDRLMGYRDGSGGFSYWEHSDADLALTAYALKFLDDAKEFINVDGDTIEDARSWIINRQRGDGSWPAHNIYINEDPRRDAMLTALIARLLGGLDGSKKSDSVMNQARALIYLAPRVDEIDEPYLIASYALAAIDAGQINDAAHALDRLRALAHSEAGGSYWALETNTPFYGWGLAGRIETTALVAQALSRASSETNLAKPGDEDLINRGLLFLLHNKDHYGVWYSTQATVNVLNTLITMLAKRERAINNGGRAVENGNIAQVLINGRPAVTFEAPASDQIADPIIINLSQFLTENNNRIEIHHARGAAQIVSSYYLPWLNASKASDEKALSDSASELRLSVKFNKTEVNIGNEIVCHVEAERIGHRGYGMMLAEIGLPPGAEVDRDSLEEAVKASGYSFSHYDILPDRLIVYLWPQAGGVKFSFKFHPRFAMNALAAMSMLYDYYNPEAKVLLAPERFLVK